MRSLFLYRFVLVIHGDRLGPDVEDTDPGAVGHLPLTAQARNKESGAALVLKGQTSADLAAGKNRRLDFALLTPRGAELIIEFVLTDEEGREVSLTEAYIGKTDTK